MKIMNFTSMLIILFFGFSCETPEPDTNEPTNASNLQVRIEQSAFYEIYLHQFALKTELYELKKLKETYLKRVEDGDKKAVALVELTSKKINLVNESIEFNNNFIPDIECKKKCPPKGPNPCGDMTCPIRIPDRPLEFWVPRDIAKTVTIVALDLKGRTSGEEISRVEVPDTNFVKITMKLNNSKLGRLEITKPYKLANGESVTYTVPFKR